MVPAVALLVLGRRRCWLPIPVILLWPLIAVALGIVALVEVVAAPRHPEGWLARTRTLAAALRQLSGLKVDVRGATGGRVFLWLL